MSRLAKIGVVFAGYVLAVAAGAVASWLYNVRVSALPYDTSGGMYAAGEAMQSFAAFLVVALIPTALALWFLRRNETFWDLVAAASLVFAGVGLLTVLMPMVVDPTPSHVVGVLLSLLGISQLLGFPLWLAAFALFALLAPTRETRRKLKTAVAVEVVIGGCALVHWFVPSPPW